MPYQSKEVVNEPDSPKASTAASLDWKVLRKELSQEHWGSINEVMKRLQKERQNARLDQTKATFRK